MSFTKMIPGVSSAAGRAAANGMQPVGRSQLRARYNAQEKRDRNLRKNYGIGLKDYNRIPESQGGVCAICGNAAGTAHFGMLVVDHCHETNQVRSLLCNECNIGLGRFKGDVDLLERAIEYLKHAPVKQAQEA